MRHAMSCHRHSSESDSEIRSAALQAWTAGMYRQVDHNQRRQFPGRREPLTSCRERTDRIGGSGERRANEIAEAYAPGCPAMALIVHSPKRVRPLVYSRCNEESENHGYAHTAFR